MNVPDTGAQINIFGAGAVVTELYLPALAALGLHKQVAILDRSSERLSKIEEAWPGILTRVGDFRAAFERSSRLPAGAVAIIALPNSLHVEACHLALASGYHVLCEK